MTANVNWVTKVFLLYHLRVNDFFSSVLGVGRIRPLTQNSPFSSLLYQSLENMSHRSIKLAGARARNLGHPVEVVYVKI